MVAKKAGVVKSRHGWTMYGNPVTSEYILDFKKCPIEAALDPYIRVKLHPGTSTHHGVQQRGSVLVIWQNQAWRLPGVHPEYNATVSGRGSNG
ncbi:hypothetical protein TNCV_1686681 [Trichonephila clavipes]|nr:hypothetical protein TNCV_1686681 [Trichonephila clavipes]